MDEIKKALDRFNERVKNKALGNAKPEMVKEITAEVTQAFAPVIQMLADNSKLSKEDLQDALRGIQIQSPDITVPEIKMPDFHIPTPQVTVNVPKADTPVVHVSPSKVDFPDSIGIHGFDYQNPLPIRLVDLKGRPYEAMSGGVSGGRGDFFTIKDIQTSSGASVIDQVEGAMKVTGSFSVSSTPFATYYASDAIGSMNLIQVGGNAVVVGNGYSDNALRVVHATDVALSVSVTGASGTLATNIVDSTGVAYSGSNPVPVTLVSGGTSTTATNLVDSTGVAYTGSNPFPVSGTVSVSSVATSISATLLNGEGVARDSWLISDVTASVKSALVDSTGVQYSGSNPLPISGAISGTVAVSSVTSSISSASIDSSGIQYSGSNPFPFYSANTLDIKQLSGSIDSMFITGSADSMFTYQVRTTNPTPKTDGNDVQPSADKLGRQLTRNHQVRDLISTFYTTLSNGTETTILTASAGTFLDPILITGTNTSTVAIQVDLRAVSAGNIVMTWMIPASTGPVGLQLPVGWPQDASGNAWTADMGDFTNTNVYLSGLMSKEL